MEVTLKRVDEGFGVVAVGREKQPTDCMQPITELSGHGRQIGSDIDSYESAEQYVHAESQDFDQEGRIQRRSGEVGEREKIG